MGQKLSELVPESEGSRFADLCRATDGCTVATKSVLHSPRDPRVPLEVTQARLSKGQLIRLFKRETGITPKEYRKFFR